MKGTYQILYITAAVMVVMVLLGGTLTKQVFNNFSEKSLNAMGIRKSAIDSMDYGIDEMLFKVNKISYEIDRIKNLFSDEKPAKVERVQNEIINRTMYRPLNEILIYFYRLIFFFIALILLFAGVVVHIIYRGFDLRRRLARLEIKVSAIAAE